MVGKTFSSQPSTLPGHPSINQSINVLFTITVTVTTSFRQNIQIKFLTPNTRQYHINLNLDRAPANKSSATKTPPSSSKQKKNPHNETVAPVYQNPTPPSEPQPPQETIHKALSLPQSARSD